MAKRRANGEGSIRKRADGRWEGRYTAGYNSETGKWISKNVLGKTQAEVKEKLARAIEESKRLDVSRTNEYTVAEWLRIVPKLEKQEMKILPPEDMKAYLNAAEKHGVLVMFYLELVTGMRKGELTALLWSDLNVEHRTISVSKQAGWNGEGELEIRRPKTENSIREISIPQTAVDLLLEEHSKHPNNPYLFPSPKTGGMYHPDSIVNLHKKILKDAGLPHIRFHDLRHTFATVALQNGVDVKTVSNMLGHYDAGFTLRTYTHATRQMQESAAEKMGNFMEQVL